MKRVSTCLQRNKIKLVKGAHMDKIIWHKPIMTKIMSYLCVIDYISVYRMCSVFWRRPNDYPRPHQVCMRAFESYLRDCRTTNFGLYMSLLQRGNVFLTGDLLLSIVTGEKMQLYIDFDFFTCTQSQLFQNNDVLSTTQRLGSSTCLRYEISLAEQVHVVHANSLFDQGKKLEFPFQANIFCNGELRFQNINSIIQKKCTINLLRYQLHRVDEATAKYSNIEILRSIQWYECRGFEITIIFTRDLEKKWPDKYTSMKSFTSSIVKRIMGRVYPESCVFTFECDCISLMHHNSTCTNKRKCTCEHCAVFYSKFLKLINKEERDRDTAEWIKFWSKKLVVIDEEMELYRAIKQGQNK